MTVYPFRQDSAWAEPVSNRAGSCPEKWPAVAPVGTDDTKGVQKKRLMSFTRSDGVKQMTVNCSPVYTFADDTEPGDTNGRGVGGTWYAMAPDGNPVGAPEQDQPGLPDRPVRPSAPHGGGGPVCCRSPPTPHSAPPVSPPSKRCRGGAGRFVADAVGHHRGTCRRQ